MPAWTMNFVHMAHGNLDTYMSQPRASCGHRRMARTMACASPVASSATTRSRGSTRTQPVGRTACDVTGGGKRGNRSIHRAMSMNVSRELIRVALLQVSSDAASSWSWPLVSLLPLMLVVVLALAWPLPVWLAPVPCGSSPSSSLSSSCMCGDVDDAESESAIVVDSRGKCGGVGRLRGCDVEAAAHGWTARGWSERLWRVCASHYIATCGDAARLQRDGHTGRLAQEAPRVLQVAVMDSPTIDRRLLVKGRCHPRSYHRTPDRRYALLHKHCPSNADSVSLQLLDNNHQSRMPH
ncbi:hypothetical protein BC831DRAFT_456845 [Entophlyctis helioformis]|nr:hypothetical protein BC831DRAFT_456845 [Entophlyctis helioformis]